MKFETKVQEECYNKVVAHLTDLAGERPKTDPDQPMIWYRQGSAMAVISVVPWGDDASVNVNSLVVRGAELTPDLMRFLLEQNHGLVYAAFEVDSDGDIWLNCDIVGSTCDKSDLKHAIRSVLMMADKYDDEIVAKWGGQRALES